jgi:hypothetical protein
LKQGDGPPQTIGGKALSLLAYPLFTTTRPNSANLWPKSSGRAGLAVALGEAGMGKTRLLQELVKAAE